MKNNQVIKVFLLGGLIFMCIIQTIILWLGGTPSQNFFEQTPQQIQGINPFNVWIIKSSTNNTGMAASVAYNLNPSYKDTVKEYEKLVTELSVLLGEVVDKSQVTVTDTIDWKTLFMTSAVCYEYELPLSLELISGIESQAPIGIGNIDTVFVSIPNKLEEGTKIHLISTSDEKTYEIIAKEQTEVFKTIYSFFTSDDLSEQITKYQPSSLSNVSQYIKGNDFMALDSTVTPIEYQILDVDYHLNERRDIVEQLEPLVNDFFANPLLKHVEVSENGQISFTEQSRNVVIYHPTGILEYINLSPNKTTSKTTVLSGYNVVKTFINNNDVIDDLWKENLYLVSLETAKDEVTYYFDMSYDGYSIYIDEAIRKELGMNTILEVTIKNNQVVRVKKAMLEIKPYRYLGVETKGILTSGYVDPINEALEVFLVQGTEGIVFDGTKASYVVKGMNETAHVARGIRIDGKWYYP